MNREENSQRNRIPDNSSSKPMDSKHDVEKSPDEKTDQDFPGYPHYPAKEDIMDQRTGSHRVDADLKEMGTGPNASGVNQRFLSGQGDQRSEESRSGTNKNLDASDSRNAEIGVPQNVSTEDLNTNLDIPGTELDDENEAIGEEDEENNYYSLGGDRHEWQEEDPQSGPDRGI